MTSNHFIHLYQKLSLLSAVVWLTSLALPGFAIYSNLRHIPGYEILWMGWLSPLVFNFAWFANVFYFYAFFQLFSGKSPVKSSFFSALLSLDTFRFSWYLFDEGGAKSLVFGYGWGAVLWIFSIFILLTAVGVKEKETREFTDIRNLFEWYWPIGIIISVILVSSTVYFSIHDRAIANPLELNRLSGLAFKRLTVCATPRPIVTDPIHDLSGPLEIIADKKLLYAAHPFLKVKELLNFGIPTIRIGSVDYSTNLHEPNWSLMSTSASQSPAAILYVNESPTHTISAKLLETSTKRIVFNQTWALENQPLNYNIYCPDYQPEELLKQALNLPLIENKSESTSPTQDFDEIEGTIIRRQNNKNYKSLDNLREQELKVRNNISQSNYNFNCPFGIGWVGINYNAKLNTGWPFRTNQKSYYSGYSGSNATCEGDFVYIYSGLTRQDKYYLSIQKRSLLNFREHWAGRVTISGLESSVRSDALKLRAVNSINNEVVLEIVNENSGELISVLAPLHDRTLL